MNKLSLFSLLVFALAFTQGAAQDEPQVQNLFDYSLEELLDVKVKVGSNVMDDYRKQPVAVTTITREQLELSGARHLVDAIMTYVPGVFIVEDQDDLIIGFRGMAPDNNSKVILLIDGVNINTEFFWGPPGALLNSTNYSYIERVEVIRGPGSVTLGQGALLGVINIITKKDAFNKSQVHGEVSAIVGENDFNGTSVHLGFKENDFTGFFAIGKHAYDGQKLRYEGWALDQGNDGYVGGRVADIGTRLKRSSNENFLTQLGYKDFTFNLMYLNQERDLYNFYRDRNVIRQSLLATSLKHTLDITDQIQLRSMINTAVDDFGLTSVDGFEMGGTQERRWGANLILNINSIKNNRLAIGGTYRSFAMGRPNRDGFNFINNTVSRVNLDPDYAERSNAFKTWVFKHELAIFSLFAENYFDLSDKVTFFGALRFDNHPDWGSNFSPRLGAIYSINQSISLKAAYQEGFRGAVGVLYSGGFLQDGLLRADNFSSVENAEIPVFNASGAAVGIESNLTETLPEKIKSMEFTIDWKINDRFNLNGVTFYNNIESVIDVGVISKDPAQYQLTTIGNDLAGDWNGFWFFKNTAGSIKQLGAEWSLVYKNNDWLTSFSHSTVQVLSSDEQQRGSMYVTEGGRTKAYPEHVTRANILYSFSKKFTTGFHYLYYYNWRSPNDREVSGNHLLNAAFQYRLHEKVSIFANINNLLGQDELYPMNNNVNNPTLSDGTPSVEKRTFWFRVSYNF